MGKSKEDLKKLNHPFKITTVCRADIVNLGFSEKEALRITAIDMLIIAEKLADDYCEQLFHSSLEIITKQVTGL